jgi:hypothetical protein
MSAIIAETAKGDNNVFQPGFARDLYGIYADFLGR